MVDIKNKIKDIVESPNFTKDRILHIRETVKHHIKNDKLSEKIINVAKTIFYLSDKDLTDYKEIFNIYYRYYFYVIDFNKIFSSQNEYDRNTIDETIIKNWFLCYVTIPIESTKHIFTSNKIYLFWEKYDDLLNNFKLRDELQIVKSLKVNEIKDQFIILSSFLKENKDLTPSMREWPGTLKDLAINIILQSKNSGQRRDYLRDIAINKYTFKGSKLTVKRLEQNMKKFNEDLLKRNVAKYWEDII